MSDSGTTFSHSTWRQRLGTRLFRDLDVSARRAGWQAQPGRSGLSRTYRDPQMDQLRACGQCSGTGTRTTASQQAEPCPSCSGTGRIRLSAPRATGARR